MRPLSETLRSTDSVYNLCLRDGLSASLCVASRLSLKKNDFAVVKCAEDMRDPVYYTGIYRGETRDEEICFRFLVLFLATHLARIVREREGETLSLPGYPVGLLCTARKAEKTHQAALQGALFVHRGYFSRCRCPGSCIPSSWDYRRCRCHRTVCNCTK